MIHALLFPHRNVPLFNSMVPRNGHCPGAIQGHVQGSARDANGAVVPGATIKLVSNYTNKTQEVSQR